MEELMKRAETGDPDAMYRLGRTYQYASGGVGPDYEKAFEWYSKAAQKKHPDAMIAVGDALTVGRGCDRDPDAGAVWYREAYELGKTVK